MKENIRILKEIAKKYNVEVYLVGGQIRDKFLNKKSTDFDFAVSEKAKEISQEFSKRIKGSFVLLDKERGYTRIVKKIEGRVYTYDFAGFRGETIEEDISLRDFTINTLTININNLEEGIDLNKVQDRLKIKEDIKNKIIKQVSKRVFEDDPLRMLRAYSLSAILKFKIDKETKQNIKENKERIRRVSYERIREELFKILNEENASIILISMDKTGLLEEIIPQISMMKTCKQGGYHHLNVWRHSLATVVQFEKILKTIREGELKEYLNEIISSDHTRKSLIKLGCLLHDIGKPETKQIKEGRMSFHSHEHRGKEITKRIVKELKLSTKERHSLQSMVLWHLRPGYLSNEEEPTKRAKYRYFRDTKEESVSIAILSIADQQATRGPLTTKKSIKHHKEICYQIIREYFEEKKKKPIKRIITGNDLIKMGIKPSRKMGEILEIIKEKQRIGEITTKEQVIEKVKDMIKEIK